MIESDGTRNSFVKQAVSIHDAIAVKMNLNGNLTDQSANASVIDIALNPTFATNPDGSRALDLGAKNDHLYFNPVSDVDLNEYLETREFYSWNVYTILSEREVDSDVNRQTVMEIGD